MKVSIKSSLNLIKESNFFTFKDKYFKQVKGAPMGCPISCILVEYKLQPLEEHIFDVFK